MTNAQPILVHPPPTTAADDMLSLAEPDDSLLVSLANLTVFKDMLYSNASADDPPSSSAGPACQGPTPEQVQLYVSFSWWLEGAAQIALGCLGFVANAVAIPILLSKEMSSIFNRLLTCMAVFDNVFIVCSVFEGVRKHIVSSEFQEALFGKFLYQFHNMILCCCIYITVVLALERYKAVWHPVEYHNIIVQGNPWRRVFYCLCPVVIFSVVFNVPKFFEVTFETTVRQVVEQDPDLGTLTVVNRSETRMAPTWLRLDDNYVLWYSNVARLVVTGIIPFASLVYLNSRIYTVIRRRRRMTNRPRAAPSAAQKAEEARQAIVLLVIVVLFLICHTLRIILNIHGLFNLQTVRESLEQGCMVFQLWTLIGASISHILLTINSSVNFVIYCFMCTTFRMIFYRNLNRMISLCGIRKLLPDVQNSECESGGDQQQQRRHSRQPPPQQLHPPATTMTAVTVTAAVSTTTSNGGGDVTGKGKSVVVASSSSSSNGCATKCKLGDELEDIKVEARMEEVDEDRLPGAEEEGAKKEGPFCAVGDAVDASSVQRNGSLANGAQGTESSRAEEGGGDQIPLIASSSSPPSSSSKRTKSSEPLPTKSVVQTDL